MTNYYNKDFYKILEINFDASEDEIKHAYRKLVRKYHPDVAGNSGDESKFKEIQQAYEVLSDNLSRERYDILHGFYRQRIKNKQKEEELKNKNLYDSFVKSGRKKSNENKDFSKSINDALDNLFHSKKQNTYTREEKKPVNGEDINLDITLSCFEAVNGTNRKVNIIHTRPCPNCEGRKFINGAECPMCKGTGQISVQKKINVKIPKGVSQGSKIRVKKEGNKGLNGGKDGDLYLVVKIEKNPYFEIEGMNILCNLPITPMEAVLGADIPIKILDSNITVKVPPMTSSGQKLRLQGLGLPNKSKTKNGDILFTVQIKLPKNMSKAEVDLYSQLYKLSDEDIRKDMNDFT